MYSLPPPPPTNPAAPVTKPKFDFTAALIRRRKAAVALLLALSIGVAGLALVAFVKLMPGHGDAVHSVEVLSRTGALEHALQQGTDAVESKTRTPKEAQAAWESVLRLAKEVADLSADDQEEAARLASFRDELTEGSKSLREGIDGVANPALEGGARRYAQNGLQRITGETQRLEQTAARQLDEQMSAARWWLAICIALVLLTGLMMAITVVVWVYANYADRTRAKALGAGPISGENAVEAAKRLSLAIDSGPLAVLEWDADFVCTRWSGRATEMFGYTADQRVGKRWDQWTNHVHPDDAGRVQRELAPLLEGRTDCVIIRHRNLHADGRVIHCAWYNSVLRDKDGRPRAFFSIADDVTRTVEVEAAYHAEAEMLRRIAEIAPVGIAVRGRDELLRFANDFILRLFGRTREDIADGSTRVAEWKIEELDGTPIPLACRPSEVAIRTGKPVARREMRVISPGTPKPLIVSCSAVPLKDDNGNIDSALVIYEDISSRVEAEEEREALSEELSRARRLETVGNLAGGIAHDFGNVLLAVSFSADALATAAAAGLSTVEPAAQLRHAIGVARELTDSLVNYAAGRDGTRRPMDLSAFIKGNCKFVARLLPPNFKVVCVPPPDGSTVMVSASGPQLLQVLMNLAVNARDAMPMGGTITLSLTADNAGASPTALLEISDTGSGMTPEVSRRAFERFYTTKAVGAGTGLGLPTVRHIVQDHGGTVELITAPGQGARFVIRLPMLLDVPAPVAAPATAPAAAAPSPQPAAQSSAASALLPQPVLANPTHGQTARQPVTPESAADAAHRATAAAQLSRAMVIESDDRVRPLIVQTLRNSGFHVESFINADAGLDAFNRDPGSWSIVLAELDGDRLDGATCVRRMRKAVPDLPALLLTADPGDASGHLADARTRVLLKPFTVGSLRSALNDLLKSTPVR